MKGRAFLLALLLALAGEAKGEIYVFSEASDSLRWAVSDEVQEETVITLTFAGDCTLGGENALKSSRNSFDSVIGAEGMSYPFAELQELFATDDFTIVNLEGVLSDSAEGKVRKTYNFLGATAYTDILTSGSVECVTLANNHSMDYGTRGFADTTKALDAAGVGYVSEENLCILEKDGVRIGLTASVFSGRGEKLMKEQVQLLRELGCSIVIHNMHGGDEYAANPSAQQKRVAMSAKEAGAALVVGHHPHVVQGAALYEKVPVLYSLGNCSFGGNLNPSDQDALLLRVAFLFRKGEPVSLEWTLYPISVSGVRGRNNYQPVLLMGEEARRLMERVIQRSELSLIPCSASGAAKQETISYKGEK
ncbi:MAG: CapA family protein [Eubacteriales bacterium]|nr:CapA family protein [Eubacteriales bacterium]